MMPPETVHTGVPRLGPRNAASSAFCRTARATYRKRTYEAGEIDEATRPFKKQAVARGGREPSTFRLLTGLPQAM